MQPLAHTADEPIGMLSARALAITAAIVCPAAPTMVGPTLSANHHPFLRRQAVAFA